MRNKSILLSCLILLIGSCTRLNEEDKSTINKYQNEYRDPELIGLWEFGDKNRHYTEYCSDGTTNKFFDPKYDKKGNIINFKTKLFKGAYFYTKDGILYTFATKSIKAPSYEEFIKYSIEDGIITLERQTDKGKKITNYKLN